MAAIGKWLVGVVLGWAVEYIGGLIQAYRARKQELKKKEDERQAAIENLEKAQTEEEIWKAQEGVIDTKP